MNAAKRYENINFPFTCPISDRKFNNSTGLSVYVTKTLKMNHIEYYDKYINHRDNSCFFCRQKGKFISLSKGYRNLCESQECVKKSFNSHSVEGIMYRKMISREEAEILYEEENNNQLRKRIETQNRLRKDDPLWDKKRSRNCIEFWMEKGYLKEESELKVKEVMSEIHEKTFSKFKDSPNKYAYKQPTRIEYYLKKGYSKEEAKKELSKRQSTFSLQKCIEKYGENIGNKIWLDRQERWQKKLSENGNIKGGYSKISQILFYDILKFYKDEDKINVFFYTKNNEIILKSDKKIYLYDFTDISKRKIIEYNGDQYHANPKIYEGSDYPHPYHKTKKYTAQEIWKKDKNKMNLAIKNGYQVLVIWDSEYRKNPQQTLEKCLDFLIN